MGTLHVSFGIDNILLETVAAESRDDRGRKKERIKLGGE